MNPVGLPLYRTKTGLGCDLYEAGRTSYRLRLFQSPVKFKTVQNCYFFQNMANPKAPWSEGLFEKLADQYADGTAIEAVPREFRRAKSISDHLWRMFNTRQGSVPHLPDYGLPDITEIYRKLPLSLKELEQTILALITKYEPRLDRVRIRPIPTTPMEFRISFELSAAVKGGDRISFQTSFTSTGESKVQPLRGRSA